jgi:hypothetical protein
MGSTESAAKTCVHCGQDCARKPRTKDGQGRYMCRECVDRLTAKAAPAAAAPARVGARASGAAAAVSVKAAPAKAAAKSGGPTAGDDDAVMAALMADAPDPCPGCTAPMTKGAVICSFCGHNLQTGEASQTRVLRMTKEKKEKSSGPRFSLDPAIFFWGYLAIQAAPLVLLVSDKDLAGVAYGIAGLCYLALVLSTVVSAFMTNVVPGILLLVTAAAPWVAVFEMHSGLLFLLLFVVQLIYWIYFIVSVCENPYIRGAWYAQFIVFVAWIVASVAGAAAMISAR